MQDKPQQNLLNSFKFSLPRISQITLIQFVEISVIRGKKIKKLSAFVSLRQKEKKT